VPSHRYGFRPQARAGARAPVLASQTCSKLHLVRPPVRAPSCQTYNKLRLARPHASQTCSRRHRAQPLPPACQTCNMPRLALPPACQTCSRQRQDQPQGHACQICSRRHRAQIRACRTCSRLHREPLRLMMICVSECTQGSRWRTLTGSWSGGSQCGEESEERYRTHIDNDAEEG